MPRSLLAATFVLVSVIASAQDVTSVSLDRRLREGLVPSGSFQLPTNASSWVLDFTPEIGASDAADLTQTVIFRIMVQENGVFRQVQLERWRGGTPIPSIRIWDLSGIQGKFVRFEIDTPRRVSAGGTLQLSVRPPEPPND